MIEQLQEQNLDISERIHGKHNAAHEMRERPDGRLPEKLELQYDDQLIEILTEGAGRYQKQLNKNEAAISRRETSKEESTSQIYDNLVRYTESDMESGDNSSELSSEAIFGSSSSELLSDAAIQNRIQEALLKMNKRERYRIVKNLN